MPEETSVADLPALRQDIRASQQTLAQFIPESDVLSVEQSPTGVLMSCPGDKHRWTGVTTVEYAAGFDVGSLYTNMEEGLTGSSVFTTKREESRWGRERLVVEDAAGTRYTIRLLPQASKVQIAASSWCFDVQPGQANDGGF